MDSYPPKEVLKDLIEGKLDWPRVKQIMSSPKDADRFEKYIALMQERVCWSEKILLPLGEHLYIVADISSPRTQDFRPVLRSAVLS